tara:strand:+ start:52 stop:270 length:219 start_codon:yes stop_codon:yes gene_type:complete
MIKILLLIIICVFSNNSFAQNNSVDFDKVCLGKTCTKPIKEFKISNFFLKQETVKLKTIENVCFGLEIRKIK